MAFIGLYLPKYKPFASKTLLPEAEGVVNRKQSAGWVNRRNAGRCWLQTAAKFGHTKL